jgi:large subunit ribosomal protein L4
VTPGPATAPSRRRERPEPERRTVERRRVDGTVIDQVVLPPEIFGIVPHAAVLHQVITAQLASARAGTQSTRTRAEVRGGGAKPFRQKGTGRARQGSTRSPQWVGGGIALGPKPRSYRQRTPKKMIRLALCSALSDRAAEGRVALVDDWTFPAPKTKDAVAALEALALEGRVLVVLGPDDGIADRSFANLPRVQTVQMAELNAYDILRSDWVVFTDTTVPGETEAAPAAAAPAKRARKTAAATKRAHPTAEASEAEPADAEPADAQPADARPADTEPVEAVEAGGQEAPTTGSATEGDGENEGTES